MSTEQSVDPELVEQTKQQIRNLVREIAQLSKSELAPLEYYDAILNRIVTALAAVGGAVWSVTDGRIELEYQINLQRNPAGRKPGSPEPPRPAAAQVATTGEGMLVAPHSGAGDDSEGGNPTDFLLVLGPLKSDQETQGIIEIFQRPGSSPNVQRGYLRFLLQMCELASDYLKTRQLRHFTDRQTLWAQLEQFTRVAHRSLDPRSDRLHDRQRRPPADRVRSRERRHRAKAASASIEAVSGQDTFDKRSNTVSLLGRLATAVAATGEAVWYTGDTTFMAPQVEEAVQAYIDESHSKAVGIIPLKRPVDPTDAPDDKDAEPPEVLGALIVEQIEDSRPREGCCSGSRSSPNTARPRWPTRWSITSCSCCRSGKHWARPMGAQSPHAAQDHRHRQRRGAVGAVADALAGRFQPGGQGHARAGRSRATCSPRSTAW